MDCVFCTSVGGETVWRDDALRIVMPTNEPDYPGFCRVIWNAHLSEFSDLNTSQRTHLMTVIAALERIVRQVMQPVKINLASLGNQVPHLHWHVIPRYEDDAHFPAPVWAPRVREIDQTALNQRRKQAHLLHTEIIANLTTHLATETMHFTPHTSKGLFYL